MLRSVVSLTLLVKCASAITQTCVFESGIADSAVPCNPNASQGTCCAEGEACLESGLCYGPYGVYRGACINEWNSDGCVTYCADKSAIYANLYPCTDGTGSSGPNYWWCGNSSDVTCSKTSGTTLNFVAGKAITILGNSTSSTASSSTSASSTVTSATTSTGSTAQQTTSNAATDKCDTSNRNLMAVGAGVGASLGALSFAMLALYLNERRRRKRVENVALRTQPEDFTDGYHYAAQNKATPNPPYEPAPQELGTERLNELGPRY